MLGDVDFAVVDAGADVGLALLLVLAVVLVALADNNDDEDDGDDKAEEAEGLMRPCKTGTRTSALNEKDRTITLPL